MNDGALIDAYRNQAAQAAFAELVRRYEGRLFRVLVGMVSDRSLAEELCQRALVKAALNLDQLTNGQAFYSWLLRVARTAALDEFKNYARRNQDPLEEDTLEMMVEPEPDHSTKNAVQSVLQYLSEDDRMVLLCAELEQLSVDEISDILGINKSAVKMRIKRARDRFRGIYQDMFGSHHE